MCHPRVHPLNYPLLREHPADHPVVRALQSHAESRDICVGKEIDWPKQGVEGIDQTWRSSIDGKRWFFSGFAYQYLSYDLILDGWLEEVPGPTNSELGFLNNASRMRILLKECMHAALEDNNLGILPLVEKASEFIDALEKALLLRFEEFGISREDRPCDPRQKRSAENLAEEIPSEQLETEFHPRIDWLNYALLREFPSHHPAARVLQMHAETCDMLVGNKTDWRYDRSHSVDQTWLSDVDNREWCFSDFIDEYILYDLVLVGWLGNVPEATEEELGILDDTPRMRELLKECEQAAREENNLEIIPFIEKLREFVNVLEQAVLLRFEQYGILPKS